jgi:hypothetical protein
MGLFGVLHFAEGDVQHGQQEIHVFPLDAHGRFDAQDIAVKAALADQQSQLTGSFEDLEAGLPKGLFALAVPHQIDTGHETLAPYIADDGALVLQSPILLAKPMVLMGHDALFTHFRGYWMQCHMKLILFPPQGASLPVILAPHFAP